MIFTPIDIMKSFTEEPPEMDFVLPGFLAGTVGALVAPGSTGKSFWALEAAMSIACAVAGGDLLDLQLKHHGAVVYFATEDIDKVLVKRVHEIGKHLNASAREAIAENLTILPTFGSRIDIMNDRHLNSIIDFCSGARLIVFDTLSRVHNLDENNNGEMSRLISTLEYIASQTEASVLYLHHVSKNSARSEQTDQQHAARGASALIDNARWCGYVAKMSAKEAETLSDSSFSREPISEDRRHLFVRFGVSKQNYSAVICDKWYKRCSGGVLVPVELCKAKTKNKDIDICDQF